jgi:DNA-binding response OmpR family regulator
MRVLIVEDTKVIADNIAEYLTLEDMDVDVAYDGEQGKQMYDTHRYDVIVLDRMLPHVTGPQLCEMIRTTSDVPVIMLTARGEIDDKLTGFECGADDYLVKPFDLAELAARVQALYRRSAVSDEFVYEGITVMLRNRLVTTA